MPRRSSKDVPFSFPFLALPSELRLEIYRHAFSIYPSIRVKPTHAALVPEAKYTKKFEVSSHSNPPTSHDYRDRTGSFLSDEEQQRRGEYRYPCQSFLSLLLVSRTVYEEAMPLFYSETLFVVPSDLWPAVCFLKGIGARRRKHIRRLSVEFWSSWMSQNVGGGRDMQKLINQLVDAERVDTLEIVLPKISEHEILADDIRLQSGTSSCRSPSSCLETYLGFKYLNRLKSLRSLRLVGRWMALPFNREDMLQRLENLGEKERHSGPPKTAVEFVLPDGIGR